MKARKLITYVASSCQRWSVPHTIEQMGFRALWRKLYQEMFLTVSRFSSTSSSKPLFVVADNVTPRFYLESRMRVDAVLKQYVARDPARHVLT